MSDQTTWIEEQKANRMFRHSGRGNDADRMLEHGDTNKITNRHQAQCVVAGRVMNDVLGITCLAELCDMVEKAQMVIDAQSRKDFMKVAIEQWQGKLQASKSKIVADALL